MRKAVSHFFLAYLWFSGLAYWFPHTNFTHEWSWQHTGLALLGYAGMWLSDEHSKQAGLILELRAKLDREAANAEKWLEQLQTALRMLERDQRYLVSRKLNRNVSWVNRDSSSSSKTR